MMTIGRTNVLIVGDCTTNNSLAMSILGWMSRCSGGSFRLHVRFGKTHFILVLLLSRNVVTANFPRNTTICNSPILLKRNSLPPPRGQLWRTQPCIPLAWIGIRILNHLRCLDHLFKDGNGGRVIVWFSRFRRVGGRGGCGNCSRGGRSVGVGYLRRGGLFRSRGGWWWRRRRHDCHCFRRTTNHLQSSRLSTTNNITIPHSNHELCTLMNRRQHHLLSAIRPTVNYGIHRGHLVKDGQSTLMMGMFVFFPCRWCR